MSRLGKTLRPWLPPMLGLLVWTLCSRGPSDHPWHSSPAQVLAAAGPLLADAEVWLALSTSLALNLIGLLLGASAGLVLGSAMGNSRRAQYWVGPSLNGLKQISLFAWLPLLSLWLGLGDGARLAFIALAAFFPMALHALDGVRAVPAEHRAVARALRFSRWQTWRHLLLPAALPQLFTGLRLAALAAWLATLGSDYLMPAGRGIGHLLIDARDRLQMDRLLLGVLLVGAVSVLMNLLITRWERRCLAWQQGKPGLAP